MMRPSAEGAQGKKPSAGGAGMEGAGQWGAYLDTALRAATTTEALLSTAITRLSGAWQRTSAALAPLHLDVLAPGAAGLVMCFFGGPFLTLIAAAEAYRLCGWQTQVKCAREVASDFSAFLKASARDDEEDADGDGVKDVTQGTKQELLVRKTLLFMRTVDPKKMSESLAALNTGFMAVIATLKLQFAKAVALGSAIASMVERPVCNALVPLIEARLPPDYRKWALPAVQYPIQAFSISVAWSMQRVISAYHSAIRGAFLAARNLLEYLARMKLVSINHEDTYLDELLAYGLVFAGLWFQLSRGFSLPFPLSALLLPFSAAETTLMWMVNAR